MGLNASDQLILISAAVLLLIGLWLVWKFANDQRDINKIITSLHLTREQDERNYKSSDELAVETGIKPERVQKLCNNSRKIRKNLRKIDSWTLV